jgi:predicted nucleotidyltransferase
MNREIINKKITEIETEHNVKILYAVESGSRAWGFDSVDSDYDIRFIYAHNKNWYLNILPKRDVIEYPIIDDFDYSGWDLRKTLVLLNKSNPVLFEWLKSPIVYYKDAFFYETMDELSTDYFSSIASIYHYLNMAAGNYKLCLQEEQVTIKKYLYVLRPILACKWIENYKEAPPMDFQKLLAQLQDKELINKINELVLKKKTGKELSSEAKITILIDFIEGELKHIKETANTFDPKKRSSEKKLENGFIKILDYMEKTVLGL